jgi:hypothetical protein
MIIESRILTMDAEMQHRSIDQIKNEPMLFNCDLSAADKLGDSMTREFISLLPDDWLRGDAIIDSRTHMLMPGWYPCIPGWHHDDVPRTRSDGQPNYDTGQVRSEHIMCIVSNVPDVCRTQFALGSAHMEVPGIGRTIYADWHKDVELLVKNKVLRTEFVTERRLTVFTDRSWHRGMPAQKDGWRWFIRATRYFGLDGKPVKRERPAVNELRHQTQVYMPALNAGW